MSDSESGERFRDFVDGRISKEDGELLELMLRMTWFPS